MSEPLKISCMSYLSKKRNTVFLMYKAGINLFVYLLAEAGMETNKDILSRKEAAKFLGICLTTLDLLDIQRTKVRHRVMFKREVLFKWIDDHTETSSGRRGRRRRKHEPV